jgi:starvation-inducible DNA-binding protein
MKPQIGITENHLANSVALLSSVLADGMTLYIKTKFHWNVCGESFMEIHKLFENQYKTEESIDEIAERINKLGKQLTMAEFTELPTLRNPKQIPISEMLTELLNDHETVIVSLRNRHI